MRMLRIDKNFFQSSAGSPYKQNCKSHPSTMNRGASRRPGQTTPGCRSSLPGQPCRCKADYHSFQYVSCCNNIPPTHKNIRGQHIRTYRCDNSLSVVFCLYARGEQQNDVPTHFCHKSNTVQYMFKRLLTLPINSSGRLAASWVYLQVDTL
jgi:hypothetical protein